MTISELRLALDLDFNDKAEVLKRHAKRMSNGSYLFVDSSNGECYLFDVNGNEVDIDKLAYIEDWLFVSDVSLKTIKIPNSVTIIGSNAFYNCKELLSVTIPDLVTSIGDYAFYGCSSLTSVTIPNSVTSIRPHVFEACRRLASVTIGNSVTSIGDFAFFYCSGLTSMTIPNNIMNIEFDVFYGCTSLKEFIFKEKSIDEVKTMKYYPWGIKDKSIIRCES